MTVRVSSCEFVTVRVLVGPFSLTGMLIEFATMKKTLLTLKTENYLVLFYVTLFTEKKEVINGGH